MNRKYLFNKKALRHHVATTINHKENILKLHRANKTLRFDERLSSKVQVQMAIATATANATAAATAISMLSVSGVRPAVATLFVLVNIDSNRINTTTEL